MEVRMIGTGSAFSRGYGNTSALVSVPTGYNLLIDCGFTTPRDLETQRIKLTDVHGILITHIHADHVGGLEEVAFKNRYLHNKRKIDLLVPKHILNDLWEHSLKGGLQHTDEGECSLEDYFNVIPLTGCTYHKPMKELIYLYNTRHVPNKQSYAVGIDGMFYTSDTKFDPGNLMHGYKKYNTIFQDCQLFKGGIHASLEELLTLPEDIQRKMYLTHYGDEIDSFTGHTGRMRFAVRGRTYLIQGREED